MAERYSKEEREAWNAVVIHAVKAFGENANNPSTIREDMKYAAYTADMYLVEYRKRFGARPDDYKTLSHYFREFGFSELRGAQEQIDAMTGKRISPEPTDDMFDFAEAMRKIKEGKKVQQKSKPLYFYSLGSEYIEMMRPSGPEMAIFTVKEVEATDWIELDE